MARWKVLITDYAWADLEIEQQILAEIGAELIAARSGEEDELVRLAAEADAIMTCWAAVTPRVIAAAPRLRGIARLGVGLDNIAVAEATRRRIPVTNVPDYCVDEVAEHTLALVLACARNIGFFHLRTKNGEYGLSAAPPMHRLRGQVLGLVGLGQVGRAVVPRAKGLGLHVVAHTPSGSSHGLDVEVVSLEELLARSDFVSLHVPLTGKTRHLIGAAQLARMKPTAYLVNTSRGAVVDQDALAQAIRQGGIAGAALDVFDLEPPDLNHPLFRSERVIVTPHAAFLSVESLEQLRQRAARQVVDVLSNRRPPHVVNPEVFGASRFEPPARHSGPAQGT